MTAENLHDAITLLPADLIGEADKKRSAPRTVIPLKRYAAMAACCALVIAGSMWCLQILNRGGAKEAAAEAPAAMQSAVYEEAADEMPAEGAPKAESAAEPGSVTGGTTPETSIYTDSSQSANTGCYQTAIPEILISGACEERILTGDERAALSRLLSSLTYRPEDVCECIAEITVTVNGEDKFFINLDEGFVRGPLGQAGLTQAQIDTLREIFYPIEED